MKIQFIYLYIFRKYSLRFLRSTQLKKKKTIKVICVRNIKVIYVRKMKWV